MNEILNDFLSLSPATQVTGLASVLGLALAIASISKRRFALKQRELEKIAADRQATIDTLENHIIERDRRIGTLEALLPSGWLALAARERENNNEKLAIITLRRGFNTIRKSLHTACLELATHHASMLADNTNDKKHLREATRQARLAAMLYPESGEASAFFSELVAIEASKTEEYTLIKAVWDKGTGFLHRSGGAGIESAVEAHSSLAYINLEAGRYRIATLLARRALTIGVRELGEKAVPTLDAQYIYACALNFVGMAEDALVQIDDLLHKAKGVWNPKNPLTLVAGFVRSQILRNLKRYDEALDAAESLLPAFEQILGESNPATLNVSLVKARALNNLGRYNEAFEIAESLLPAFEQSMGKEHPDTLGSRHLKADILNNLKRYGEALDNIETLLPVSQEILGEKHPKTLTDLHLKVQIFCNLKRYDEALTIVETLLPIRQEVLGEKHPDTLSTWFLKVFVLDYLDRYDEAFDALETCLPLYQNKLGEQHPDTLSILVYKAKIFLFLKRYNEARNVIDNLIPTAEVVFGKQHPIYLHALQLRENILKNIER